jgi:hypothetical protein
MRDTDVCRKFKGVNLIENPATHHSFPARTEHPKRHPCLDGLFFPGFANEETVPWTCVRNATRFYLVDDNKIMCPAAGREE